MATSLGPSTLAADRQWFILGRWQEYEGESRTNLLRTVGIASFYCVELINYTGWTSASSIFRRSATGPSTFR
jgi:hypothetical protein